MKFLLHYFFLFALCGATACGGKQGSSPKKPTILVSIAPYQMLTERIVGDKFTVLTVVPTESNPHAYEPTPKQMEEIGQGILWFRIGESFEKKILPVLKEKTPRFIDVDLCQGIHLLQDPSHTHCKCLSETGDRHIWLNPKMAISQVHLIAKVLSREFPQYEESFCANAKTLIQDFEDLDCEIREILQSTKQRSFVVSHPAFAYFCKEYNLTQLSIESGGKDPTPKYLTKMMQDITSTHTKLGLAMPQHSNKGLELIAEKLHLHIQMIDPYAPNCLETMRLLAHLVSDLR